MERLSKSQEAILEVMDAEIGTLETKLAKVQPLIDELARLRRTRATLLNERTPTGGVGTRTGLTMETVIQAFRSSEYDTMSVSDLAKACGVSDTVMRSHLNRYRDQRYTQDDDGEWRLIGEEE